MTATNTSVPVLQVQNLSVLFSTEGGGVQALDDVSLHVSRNEVLGLVGESGCGKSTVGMSIMRLLPMNAQVSGKVVLAGKDLVHASRGELEEVRGARIGMVFQEPMTALNPVMTVGQQIMEVLRAHQPLSKAQARVRTLELIDVVGLKDPLEVARCYPFQLSGGMRQRIVIAIAIACEPEVIVADEPTTALDVTVQAQILDLLKDLRSKMGLAMILITHDLSVISYVSDRVAVMYAGRIVEQGPTQDVLRTPRHPYTSSLLAAVPQSRRGDAKDRRRLGEIPGRVPTLDGPATHCTFGPRCGRAVDGCWVERPELRSKTGEHHVACFNPVDSI